MHVKLHAQTQTRSHVRTGHEVERPGDEFSALFRAIEQTLTQRRSHSLLKSRQEVQGFGPNTIGDYRLMHTPTSYRQLPQEKPTP